LKALGLAAWQMLPVRVEWDYYTVDGTYAFSVVREYAANGDKKFWQGVRNESGQIPADGGRSGVPDVLWRAPDLAEWAAKTRNGTLYLTEGEKDALVLLSVLGPDEFATTGPGGAARWEQVLTDLLVQLVGGGVVSQVVIMCDRDNAGIKRGHRLQDTLQDALGDDVVVICQVPQENVGKDIAQVIDRYATDWRIRVEPVDQTAEMAILGSVEGTAATGRLKRISDPETDRTVLALIDEKGNPRIAVAGDVSVLSWWPVEGTKDVAAGWELRIRPLLGVDHVVVLEASTLADSRSLAKWLVAVGLGKQPGIGLSDLGQSLTLWLRWQIATNATTAATRVVPVRTLGWVDGHTGRPASAAESDCQVFVTERGETLVQTGTLDAAIRYVGEKSASVHLQYDLVGTEDEAREVWRRVLTFADRDVVAVVAGWVGQTLLQPWVARHSAIRPGLAVVSASGSGKTNGASAMLLALGGCTRPITFTYAALRRVLAAGVGTVRWADDSDKTEDKDIKELLRVATTRADHILATPDAGTTATDTAELSGSVVVSAEGVGWLRETAMADRFVLVSPPNPQGRTSQIPGREGRPQWDDVKELFAEYNSSSAECLAKLAGWTVKGLVAAALAEGKGSVAAGVDSWATAGGSVRGRRGAVGLAVGIGARAVAAWLGEGASWLVEEVDAWRTEEEESYNEASCALTDFVLPRLIHEHQVNHRLRDRSLYVIDKVDTSDMDSFKISLKHRLKGSGGDGIPPVLVDLEGYYWVATQAVAVEYKKLERDAEERTCGALALGEQVRRIADDPDWAHYRGGKTNNDRPGARISVGGAGRVVYRRLSGEASELVRDRLG
jgi:hypothetical protein